MARLGSAVAAVASLALLLSVTSVSAAPNGTVTVTGASDSKIVLTVGDASADFGDTLTPDGAASNSSDNPAEPDPPVVVPNVDPDTELVPSVGACYEWPGSLRVKSNVTYDVEVSADASSVLYVLDGDPADYDECVGGSVFATSGMADLATGQENTKRRSHTYFLGFDVRWEDGPGTVSVTDVDVTFTATEVL
jgi:hypothetical protein